VTYLMDTNAVIAVLRNRPAEVRRRLRHAVDHGGTVALSPIVLFELWYGVARSQRRLENADRLRVFLSGAVEVAGFEEEDAAIAGELRASLESAGKMIGPYDILIAAQALRMGSTLVTANVSEFGRVRGLAWQDWSTPKRVSKNSAK
jgi:tRNA(fMet)-specific endonuclease VapC